MTAVEALALLKKARDSFWFSLGAYALLTKEPAMSEISKYDISIYEGGEINVSEIGSEEPFRTGYTIGFNAGLGDLAARYVVDNSFRQMIIDSNHAVRAYVKLNSADVVDLPEVKFIRHYRNAIAHNGQWNFDSAKDLPLTWRNRTLTMDMNHQSIEGYLNWFEGLQLCSQLNIFITQHSKK